MVALQGLSLIENFPYESQHFRRVWASTPPCIASKKIGSEIRPIFFFFFVLLSCSPSFFLSLLIIEATQIRGHMAAFPPPPAAPPSPLRFVPSFLSPEYFSHFFPRRLAPYCTAVLRVIYLVHERYNTTAVINITAVY